MKKNIENVSAELPAQALEQDLTVPAVENESLGVTKERQDKKLEEATKKDSEDLVNARGNLEGLLDSQTSESYKGEIGLDGRYKQLSSERNAIQSERDLTFAISMMQTEGLQTLVDEYGGDAVLDAIKKQFEANNKKDKIVFTFEVIKQLEPDKKKRSVLYKKNSIRFGKES